MLLNDLYMIEDIRASEGAIRATFRLNAMHPIFDGHFPGRPVLPGACQVQLVREVLSHIRGKTYRLLQAGQIKFLAMIDPRENGTLRLDLHHEPVSDTYEPTNDPPVPEKLRVTATLHAGDTVCLKFNGIFAAE